MKIKKPSRSGRLESPYELQKYLGGFGQVLIGSVSSHQLPGFYRFLQIEDKRWFLAGAQPDEHICDEGGSHAPGAKLCRTQDAVPFKDYLGLDPCGLAEIIVNGSHTATGLQDDEGLVLEGLEGNGWIGQGLHPVVLAHQGVMAGHGHKDPFFHERHGAEGLRQGSVEQGKVHMALEHMLLEPGGQSRQPYLVSYYL